jgi:transposase
MATFRQKFLKKFKVENKGYSLNELSKISGISKSTLQKVYNRGIGAYKTNIQSVRLKGSFKKDPKAPKSARLSKEQWAFARVYGFIMKNPKQVGKGKPDSDLV